MRTNSIFLSIEIKRRRSIKTSGLRMIEIIKKKWNILKRIVLSKLNVSLYIFRKLFPLEIDNINKLQSNICNIK